MKNTIFQGAGVAIVTPMYPDGSVNYDQLRKLIDFQIDNHTDALIICGTTGESSTLNDTEHLEVIKEAVIHVAGRVPVIAGTGSNDTLYAADMSTQAESLGADALLLVTPYYNKTSQSGLLDHYFYIADRVSIPIIVYNVPSRTGLNILPETYLSLAKHDNITAIKEANGNISAIAKTMALCGDKLDLYSGNDDQIVPLMSLGGKGVISVASNVVPQAVHDICQLYLAGDTKASREMQLEYLQLFHDLFMDVSPIPVKAAMNMVGFDVGRCRMPLGELSDGNMEKMRNTLRKYSLLEQD